MHWGYAILWHRSFLTRDPDPLMAKLMFLRHYGLQHTSISVDEADALTDAQRDRIGAYLAEHDMSVSLYVGIPYFDDDRDLIQRRTATILDRLAAYTPIFRSTLVRTGAEHIHRFVKQPPLAAQLERLAEVLPTIVQGCKELGVPFGIENHGDYYCSDLVTLCGMVPGLGIFLDTGNTYLIGEAPLPAFRAAAPYVVGTHWKDQYVRPNFDARPLHFEVAEAVLGEGDVPLRECYDILLTAAPNPAALVMEIELFPPSGVTPLDAFDRSLQFIRSLPEGAS